MNYSWKKGAPRPPVFQDQKVTAPGMKAKLINIAINQTRTALTSEFMVLQSQFESIKLAMKKNVFKGKPVEYHLDVPLKPFKKAQTLLEAFVVAQIEGKILGR